MSNYDNLHICSVCGDKYTQRDICWSCRAQDLIDKDGSWVDRSDDDMPMQDFYDEPCWCDYCGRILKCGTRCMEYDCPNSPNLGRNML